MGCSGNFHFLASMLLDIGTTQPILHIFASSFAKSSGKKNTSLLWQGNRHYTAHTLASQTKLFIPQEPNVESCVSCGCLKIRKNHPKCLLIDSRNPMFFFFFWDPIETRLLCVSLYPNPMAVGLQVQGLQLQWTSQPLEVKQLRFLLPKTLG